MNYESCGVLSHELNGTRLALDSVICNLFFNSFKLGGGRISDVTGANDSARCKTNET